MSGDYQHFIPQHVLKGFAFKGADGGRCMWVFQKDTPPEQKPIKAFGGGDNFYSPPAEAGVETLDTKITKYENRLANFVRNLRKQNPGPVPNSDVPAEVIAHLTMRAESVRSGFTFASKLLVAKAMEFFGEEENLRSVFGLDQDQPAAMLQDNLRKLIDEHPALKQSGLPPQALERVLFGYIKENFPKFFAEKKSVGRSALVGLHVGADKMVRDSHNKSLESTLVPEFRVQKLSQMYWSILRVDAPLVLPDCVAISIDTKGGAKPYVWQDADEIATVAMPLTSNKLLIGKVRQDEPFNTALFNLRAIACSENFFVSSVKTDELEEWAKYIGVESKTLMFSTIEGVFSEYLAKKTSIEKTTSSEPPREGAESVPSWQIHFLGCADEPTAQKIGAAVSAVVAELKKVVPLNRIDGITFAQDYPTALQNLDRGFGATEPLSTTTEEGVVGVAMSPMVQRDGVVKTHIVLQRFIGEALISEDSAQEAQGYQILVGALVEASCNEMFDIALPGVLLKPFDNAFDSYRFAGLSFAWCNYISARFTAKFAESSGTYLRDILIAALDRAGKDILEYRFEYRFHGDIPKFMDATFARIKPMLLHGARLAGHFDGLEAAPFDEEGSLQAAFERLGLRQWFDSYCRDLRRLWDRLGQWDSLEEFVALGGHVERLLWQFGIILWMTEDGGCRIEVPLASDAQRLMAHQAAQIVDKGPPKA